MVKIKLKTNSAHLPKNQVVEVEEMKAKELVASGVYIYNTPKQSDKIVDVKIFDRNITAAERTALLKHPNKK
jgi:hypothetical protein